MFKKTTIAAALIAAFLLLLSSGSAVFAQGKSGARPDKGGGGNSMGNPSGGGFPGAGQDRVYDPAGSRTKDPFIQTERGDRVYDPAGTRTKDPGIPSERQLNRYNGIANKLGTTPASLSTAYASALKSDPDLTFGQFVAANVVADNLNSRFPKVTAASILLGIQNGDSLGRTLRNLGVGADEAKMAEKAAKRQISDSMK